MHAGATSFCHELFNLAGIEIELVDVVILLRHIKFGTVDSGELTHGRNGFLSRGEGSRHESHYSRLQVQATGANPERPGTAWTIRDHGISDSFGRAYATNQG